MSEYCVQLLSHSTLRFTEGETPKNKKQNYSNCLEMDYSLLWLLQNKNSMRASPKTSHPAQGNKNHLLNEWINECFIPVNFLTLFSHHISI